MFMFRVGSERLLRFWFLLATCSFIEQQRQKLPEAFWESRDDGFSNGF